MSTSPHPGSIEGASVTPIAGASARCWQVRTLQNCAQLSTTAPPPVHHDSTEDHSVLHSRRTVRDAAAGRPPCQRTWKQAAQTCGTSLDKSSPPHPPSQSFLVTFFLRLSSHCAARATVETSISLSSPAGQLTPLTVRYFHMLCHAAAAAPYMAAHAMRMQ